MSKWASIQFSAWTSCVDTLETSRGLFPASGLNATKSPTHGTAGVPGPTAQNPKCPWKCRFQDIRDQLGLGLRTLLCSAQLGWDCLPCFLIPPTLKP